MVVTAGACIREKSEEWKQAGEFFKAHAIQALAIETAEATAEWLHRRIREDWGFPDPPTITMHDRFTSQVSRQTLQLRLPGLSQSRRSAGRLEAAPGPKTSASS